MNTVLCDIWIETGHLASRTMKFSEDSVESMEDKRADIVDHAKSIKANIDKLISLLPVA